MSNSESKESVVQESVGSHSVIPSDNFVNTVIPVGASVAKAKGRIITTQSKLNARVGSAILVSGNNVSCATGNNIQSEDARDASSSQDDSSTNTFF